MLSALSAPVCPEQTGIYFYFWETVKAVTIYYCFKKKKKMLLLFGNRHYLPGSDGMYQKTFIQEVRF